MNQTQLLRLFAEHIYGALPDAAPVHIREHRVDQAPCDDVMAVWEQTVIQTAQKTIHVLLVRPLINRPYPVFLCLNAWGNHSVHPSPVIAVHEGWVPDDKKPVARGAQTDRYAIASLLKAGFAFVTYHESDVAPDHPDFNPGGCLLSQWAWGMMRCIDYLVTYPCVNIHQIGVAGFSRRGKAALWAAAQDPRIALTVAHQSGTGGAAPSVKTNPACETVAQINERFPHWFSPRFHDYNSSPEKLPVSQDQLMALIAPRPLLITNARDDIWSDPDGTWDTVQRAMPYFYASADMKGALKHTSLDLANPGRLAYFIRDGEHSHTHADWDVFIKFACFHFGMR